jgi:hypothetical protein
LTDRRKWGGGGAKLANATPTKKMFFYLRIIFYQTFELKREKQKSWSESGGKGRMCNKDWLQLIFPLLTQLPRKLKLVVSIAGRTV